MTLPLRSEHSSAGGSHHTLVKDSTPSSSSVDKAGWKPQWNKRILDIVNHTKSTPSSPHPSPLPSPTKQPLVPPTLHHSSTDVPSLSHDPGDHTGLTLSPVASQSTDEVVVL